MTAVAQAPSGSPKAGQSSAVKPKCVPQERAEAILCAPPKEYTCQKILVLHIGGYADVW
jgi:hypothetical protein